MRATGRLVDFNNSDPALDHGACTAKEDAMNNTRQSKSGALKRYLIPAPALVVGLSLAFTSAASAQIPFQASVKATTPPPKGCPTTSFCGTASIAGYGPAT